MKIEEPVPTAPMAAGPSRRTMMVSTMPIVIHPSSATITGIASESIGRSSRRTGHSGRYDGDHRQVGYDRVRGVPIRATRWDVLGARMAL